MWQRAKNQYHLLVSFLANLYYGFPSKKLTVIGVTGTSGKTTTAHMIYEILKKAGYKVSLVSSIQAILGGKDLDTGFHITTPDPHVLPKYLNEIVKRGDTYAVIEVSSHALDQGRAAFIKFKVGVLTSLAHEHLDYHKTFQNYAKAKLILFHHSDHVIYPFVGIPEQVKNLFDEFENKSQTFGMTAGDITQKDWDLHPKIMGDFNILNALASAGAALLVDVKKDVIIKAIEEFDAIPGRFEEIKNKKGFRIIIDFAHKPNALESVITAARSQLKDEGRVIALFGCASERDVLKRPMMGEISGKLAEITVLTDEDPRNEDPMKIIDEMAEGCLKAGAKEESHPEFISGSRLYEIPKQVRNDKNIRHIFFKIPNRKEAINFIINKLAKSGDIILLCGKGHEKSMNYKGKELPYSEHKSVEAAIQK